MRIFSILLLIAILLTMSSCSGEKSSEQDLHSNSVARVVHNNQNTVPDLTTDLASHNRPTPRIPREPITQEYFDEFIESTLQFSLLRFEYSMSYDENNPNARKQVFQLKIPMDIDNSTYLIRNRVLSDIINYKAYYKDRNLAQRFKCLFPSNTILPIFQTIQSQGDYYFNAGEYGGEESLDIALPRAFGHVNYITMTIQEPELEPFDIPPHKTLCKGWDPGDDPPAELMPLIAYLESVIIPEMRQHPYP
ncbi:hypothetical protein J7L05_06730 [bacterium]|nr:hypothetical protein [bacterium]